MNNFTYSIPTTIHFGKGHISHLSELAESGSRVLLVYGGGSAIDCAKVIAAGAKYDGDTWDLVLDPGKILAALPVYAVSTISATGSEMDGIAVISDLTKNEKWATAAQILRPVMSILDPEYTFTVSPRQTSASRTTRTLRSWPKKPPQAAPAHSFPCRKRIF